MSGRTPGQVADGPRNRAHVKEKGIEQAVKIWRKVRPTVVLLARVLRQASGTFENATLQFPKALGHTMAPVLTSSCRGLYPAFVQTDQAKL